MVIVTVIVIIMPARVRMYLFFPPVNCTGINSIYTTHRIIVALFFLLAGAECCTWYAVPGMLYAACCMLYAVCCMPPPLNTEHRRSQRCLVLPHTWWYCCAYCYHCFMLY